MRTGKEHGICISGVGIVSALGLNVPETLDSLAQGQVNAGPLGLFQTPIQSPVFEIKRFPESSDSTTVMRTNRLGLAASREAMTQAQGQSNIPPHRLGVCMGTTVACQLNDLDFYAAYRQTGTAPLQSVDRYLKGNLAETIAREVGAQGPCSTIVNACSSSADAIGMGILWIRQGLCDAVLAGGADELNRIPLAGFHSLGIMSPEVCRPFDKNRKGLNLGEGAGAILLESRASATRRGLTPILMVAGYGAACDAYHLTAPRPDGAGLETAIRNALRMAGISPGDIAFANAHGTATPDNDQVESEVLCRVFGKSLKMLSTKGYTGHTLGAAGALEAAFTTLALREGWVPASAGFQTQDDAIPLTPLTQRTAIAGSWAISTSLAFGGNNAALVLGKVAP